jgi:hypothetical protein
MTASHYLELFSQVTVAEGGSCCCELFQDSGTAKQRLKLKVVLYMHTVLNRAVLETILLFRYGSYQLFRYITFSQFSYSPTLCFKVGVLRWWGIGKLCFVL